MWTTILPANPTLNTILPELTALLSCPNRKRTRCPGKSPQTSRIDNRSFRAFPPLHRNPPPKIFGLGFQTYAFTSFPPRHSGHSSNRKMACGVETAFRLTRRGSSMVNHSAAAVSCAGSSHIPAGRRALTAYRGNTTFYFSFPSAWFLSCPLSHHLYDTSSAHILHLPANCPPMNPLFLLPHTHIPTYPPAYPYPNPARTPGTSHRVNSLMLLLLSRFPVSAEQGDADFRWSPDLGLWTIPSVSSRRTVCTWPSLSTITSTSTCPGRFLTLANVLPMRPEWAV